MLYLVVNLLIWIDFGSASFMQAFQIFLWKIVDKTIWLSDYIVSFF